MVGGWEGRGVANYTEKTHRCILLLNSITASCLKGTKDATLIEAVTSEAESFRAAIKL